MGQDNKNGMQMLVLILIIVKETVKTNIYRFLSVKMLNLCTVEKFKFLIIKI